MGIKYREYENVHVLTRQCNDSFQIDDIITSFGNKGTVVDVKITAYDMLMYVTVFYVPRKEVS